MKNNAFYKELDRHDDVNVIPNVLKTAIGQALASEGKLFSVSEIDLDIYDLIIVSMSGGKDSIASLLYLIEKGVDMSKVELWHNLVDGKSEPFMDWLFMDSYNKQLAKAFNLPIYNSWLMHGFEGEMLKNNSISHEYEIETPSGNIIIPRKRAKAGTRLRFPQQSADLRIRWCSSALKIEVGRRALSNQERFNNSKVLFVTGERREESPNRAKYFQLETHFCDNRNGKKGRLIDAYRPVLDFTERQVWEILERQNVAAPIPYRLGWSRSSCMTCIYNSPKVWATIKHYFPNRIDRIFKYEEQFATTISRKKINVINISEGIQPFNINDLVALDQAMRKEYTLPIFTKNWELPMGAFNKEGCGSE
ncbi:TPA: phosphoadenosine phosphosulfate reductase family protein [Acinetobacter baumannii]|nr:phosphoadenosine phosphosulfate reductase family protein [Acinetobacter baumannii]EKU5972291.1 phosphoadenosine phosphosulfate reductase family protein [Acinetobacter baumannii]EKV0013563.1 phosphoadenosine phosphosulfate reductase family protein [Acinetobacter baumannii]EKV0021567.1 phosphoadenosine phosphosulfate reductase family protein [Acinetobacter baumannii]EKV2183211.1 phosphoadenosine phosphosulfate reductase family protein [Acinetobacter baumannii]